MKWWLGMDVVVEGEPRQGRQHVQNCVVTKVGRKYFTAGGFQFDFEGREKSTVGWIRQVYTPGEYAAKVRILEGLKRMREVVDLSYKVTFTPTNAQVVEDVVASLDLLVFK